MWLHRVNQSTASTTAPKTTSPIQLQETLPTPSQCTLEIWFKAKIKEIYVSACYRQLKLALNPSQSSY